MTTIYKETISIESIEWADSLAQFATSLAAGNVSPHTSKAYVADVRQFLAWLEETTGAVQPADVNRRDVLGYLAYLGRELKQTGVTRARKLASIRAYFRQLEQAGELAESPVKGIAEPKRELPARDRLSTREYEKLLNAAASHLRDYALLQVFLQAGLRLSEVAGLRLGDLDFEGKLLTVRQGKGRKSRVVDFVAKAREAVTNYQRTRPQTFDDHLFLNRYGQPLGERSIERVIDKYVARAGVEGKDVSPHVLRHTWASVKHERGVPLVTIQHQAGHKHPSTTSRYVHEDAQHRAKLMEQTSL